MEKVRIGILGCANVAEKHSIKAFKSIDNAELICIASRNPQKAEEWANRYDIIAEKSYETLLNREDIDAVYIPLPIGLHEEWVIKATKAGKHVICEKSLTDSLNSARKMVDTAKSKEVVLYENFMTEYHPQHIKVLSLIHEGAIGKPFLFRGYFGFPPLDKKNFRYNKGLGGGSLNDAGAYPIFMARKMLELEPQSVTCKLVIDNETNVDIQGSAFLEFPRNQVALTAFGFNQIYQNNYTIWGSEGLINVNRAFTIPTEMKPSVELLNNVDFKEVVTPVEIQPANHFALIFQDFCNTILKKDDSKRVRKYNELMSQAKVMEAARISAKNNRKVMMDEIK